MYKDTKRIVLIVLKVYDTRRAQRLAKKKNDLRFMHGHCDITFRTRMTAVVSTFYNGLNPPRKRITPNNTSRNDNNDFST